MGIVIYKQLVVPPRNADELRHTINYVRYVGTRPGVAYVEGTDHGLFGALDGTDDVGPIGSVHDAIATIREANARGTILYKGYLSLLEEDAMQLGLDTRQDWQRMLNARMHIISEEMHIPMERLCWTAAVHMTPGHPHVHFVYWDSDQGVRRAFVQAALAKKIRKRMIREMFGEQFAALYESKAQARVALRAGGELLDELDQNIMPSRSTLDRAMFGAFRPVDSLLALRNIDEHLPDLLRQINEIEASLPGRGRLAFDYMPEEAKTRLRAASRFIIENTPQCREAFDAYIEGAVQVSQYYSDQPENHVSARNRAETEALKMVSNRILGFIKENREENRSPDRAGAQQLWSDVYADLLRLLNLQQEQEQRQKSGHRSELSKAAKLEHLEKQKFAGEDWELS